MDFVVKDKGKEYRAFIIGGHSANSKQPALAQDFQDSMSRIKEIAMTLPKVEVNLANHPHKNNLFANRDKKKDKPTENPFISSERFFQFIGHQKELAIQAPQKDTSLSTSE